MSLTVKTFAKALKIEPKVLLERMESAGLKHKSENEEITATDKKELLLFLKDRKSSPRKITSAQNDQTSSSKKKTSKNFGDNIEAKRKAAAEQLKEQQKKREDQIKEAIRIKQEQQKTSKKNNLNKRNVQKISQALSMCKINYPKQLKSMQEKNQVLR